MQVFDIIDGGSNVNIINLLLDRILNEMLLNNSMHKHEINLSWARAYNKLNVSAQFFNLLKKSDFFST